MVMNHVLLRQGRYSDVYADIVAVRTVATRSVIVLKLILDKIAEAAGAGL